MRSVSLQIWTRSPTAKVLAAEAASLDPGVLAEAPPPDPPLQLLVFTLVSTAGLKVHLQEKVTHEWTEESENMRRAYRPVATWVGHNNVVILINTNHCSSGSQTLEDKTTRGSYAFCVLIRDLPAEEGMHRWQCMTDNIISDIRLTISDGCQSRIVPSHMMFHVYLAMLTTSKI